MEVDSDHEAGGASGGAGPSGAPGKERKRFEVKTLIPVGRYHSKLGSGEEVECCCTVGLGHCGGQLCHLQVLFLL